jgi:hypothetical protein
MRRCFEQTVPRHPADEADDLSPRLLRRAREAKLNGEAQVAARAEISRAQ